MKQMIRRIRNLAFNIRRRVNESNDSSSTQGKTVLHQILDASKHLEFFAVEIAFNAESTTYSVLLKDGRKAAGVVHQSYATSLKQYLQKRLQRTENDDDILISNPSPTIFRCEKGVTTAVMRPYVLIVEDNPSFLTIISRYLFDNDITVTTALNGVQALEILHSTADTVPSIIICDLHMPNKNGFQLIKELKASDRFGGIPIISLTSDKDVEAELSLLQLGVTAFISKHEDPRILLVHVKRILHRHGATEERKQA